MTCSLFEDFLASYTQASPEWENSCAQEEASYHLYLRAQEYQGSIECSGFEGLHVRLHGDDRTCYGLTASSLTYREAREVCLSYGGELLHYHERLQEWLTKEFGGFTAWEDDTPWVIGYSNASRPMRPLMLDHLIQPATLTNGSICLCHQDSCSTQRHLGICELPPLTQDIRMTNASYNSPCAKNECQHGGTCFTTLPGTHMCSCPNQLHGNMCEKKGEILLSCVI